MKSSLANFTDFLERNIQYAQLPKNLIILYTEEYEHLAQSLYAIIQPSFNVTIKKLNSIFDVNLENYILEKDIFLLLYTIPWHNIKNYLSQIRPILNQYANRSYVVRDCANHFDIIYQSSYDDIINTHKALLNICKDTKKVLIKNSFGTSIEFTFNEKTPWREIDGTNIPNEIVPSEISNYTPHVNGRIVFTGAMVSLVPIGKKYGLITDPIIFNVENGYITDVSSENKKLEKDVLSILNYCPGNREVVELGIGTNAGVHLLGLSAPFEERKAGFHLGIGGYQPMSQHVDFIFDAADIYFDGDCAFSNNQFHI